MKFPATFAALLATTSLLLAQATTTTTTTTPTAGAAKPKPLAASDKSFIKNSTDGIYFLTNLSDKVRSLAKDGNLSEGTKTLGNKMGSELGKIWGEIGGIATASGETLPSQLKGSDKTKVASLSKLKEDKFEKEFAELSSKEGKKLVQIFESGSKSAQNPELKAIAEKWIPTVKGISDDAAALVKTTAHK
jgi:putative membrane protein